MEHTTSTATWLVVIVARIAYAVVAVYLTMVLAAITVVWMVVTATKVALIIGEVVLAIESVLE